MRRTYTALFNVRPDAEIQTIVDFPERLGGHVAFNFTPTGGTPAQWRCKRWSGPTWVSATHKSLRCEFVEDFSP